MHLEMMDWDGGVKLKLAGTGELLVEGVETEGSEKKCEEE